MYRITIYYHSGYKRSYITAEPDFIVNNPRVRTVEVRKIG